MAWTFKNIASFGGDPEKIFVTGISAGGYLTAMVGRDKNYLAKHGLDANRIAGLIPVTGQMITHQTVRKEQGGEPSKFRPTIDKYAPLDHVRQDAPPILCVTGGWEVDMLMRAEENLYFVSMLKLVGHKAARHVVIEGADHGRCGAECWPHLVTKTVRRIARPCGEGLLRLRTHELRQFREGKLPAGRELAGKRVSVQIDGGRSRIRGDFREARPVPDAINAEGLPCENVPGRSRKRRRQTFDADGREPRLLTIFVHDEHGRMVKQSQATVDGTFQGPDALAERLATSRADRHLTAEPTAPNAGSG